MTDPGEERTLGQRLLAPIAEVRREEVAGVLLLTLLMFLILAAYYFLKTAREVFILSEGGAEVKSYSSAGQALLLLLLVPAYGAFASRVHRLRLVQGVTLFFVLHLTLFLAALGAGLHVGIVYFLWLGIFNVVVIAQFWGFASDLYTKDQGKRLFPVIGVGASLGAWLGSIRAGTVLLDFGAPRLLVGAGVVLVVSTVLTGAIDRVVTKASPQAPAGDWPTLPRLLRAPAPRRQAPRKPGRWWRRSWSTRPRVRFRKGRWFSSPTSPTKRETSRWTRRRLREEFSRPAIREKHFPRPAGR
jgi:AAA family ATP:ADP antiporter